jgi:hypothetical protein
MIPLLVEFLQSLKNPLVVVVIGLIYIVVYYFMAARFHHYAKTKNYRGIWRKKGLLDKASSVMWVLSAIGLTASLIDLMIRNALSLRYIFAYYILFVFLFAFVYNLLEWHFEGMIDGMKDGLIGEVQCLTMSIQVMTGGYHTSAKPANWRVEVMAGVQAIVGVMFIAVFVARAVVAFTPSR